MLKPIRLDTRLACPHCQAILEAWEPHETHDWSYGWDHTLHYCVNNDCGYFQEGRRRIARGNQRNFAYRYCYDPEADSAFPLVAWCGGHLSLLKGRCQE